MSYYTYTTWTARPCHARFKVAGERVFMFTKQTRRQGDKESRMTVVLDAEVAPLAPETPAQDDHADAADALEEIIAAHRQALLALAPHQEERAARIETGWHMEHLGLLLCVRDAVCLQTPPHPARDALRAGQADRVQAGMAYREAGGDPVEEIMTLLPQAQGEGPLEQRKAPPGMVPNREGPQERTGTARSRP